MADSELSPKFAPFIGMVCPALPITSTSFAMFRISGIAPADNYAGVQGGIAAAMIFGCAGAAYGTAKSGIGIAGVGTFRPDLIMKVRNIHCLDLALSLPTR